MPYTNVNQIREDYAEQIEQYGLRMVDHVVDVETFGAPYKEYILSGCFWEWNPDWIVKAWLRYRREKDAWYVDIAGYSKDDNHRMVGGDELREGFEPTGDIVWFDTLDDALAGAYDYQEEKLAHDFEHWGSDYIAEPDLW